eukprot:2013091-Pyramimonas_sp.AAC.1
MATLLVGATKDADRGVAIGDEEGAQRDEETVDRAQRVRRPNEVRQKRTLYLKHAAVEQAPPEGFRLGRPAILR